MTELTVKLARFGRRLQQIREHRGLTQTELGIAVGKSKQAISDWEDGLTIAIATGDVTKCARALGCRRSDLLGPVDAPIPDAPTSWPRFKRRLQQNCALRRLRKDRPDLYARVLARELSLHAAMIEAGWADPREQNRWRVGQEASESETQLAAGGTGRGDAPGLEHDVRL